MTDDKKPRRVHADAIINLMRGLQPPSVGQSPATDEELRLLEMTREQYEGLQ